MADEAHLLSEIGHAAREADVLEDPRWLALAEGTLDAEGEAELVAAARAAGMDEDAIAAFRPRGGGEDERLAEVALGALRGGEKARGEKAGEGEKEKAGEGAREKGGGEKAGGAARETAGGPSNVVAFRRRWQAGVVAAVALAAGVALFLGQGGGPELPGYSMQIEGGVKDVRLAPSVEVGVPEIVAESRVVISLRPAQRVVSSVGARGFLVGEAGAIDWNPRVEVSEGGAVRIAGVGRELFRGVPAGNWQVVVAVGDPAKLPEAGSGARVAVSAGAGYVVVRREVRWAGERGPGE